MKKFIIFISIMALIGVLVCLVNQPKPVKTAEKKLLEEIIYERITKKAEVKGIGYERATFASQVE